MDGSAERIFDHQLPNCRGFRDMGGVSVSSGAVTRSGLLYRSGRLSALTPEEQRFIFDLGIRVVVDLRSPDEALAHPDRIPEGIRYESAAADVGDLSLEAVIALFRQVGEGKADSREHVAASYRTMPFRYGKVFRQLFCQLLEAACEPMLVHCTGGKDRTGLFAAIYLLALGADRSTVMEDYLLSGYRGAELEAAALRYARQFRMHGVEVDPEHTWPLLTTIPDFLEAALDAIETETGSIDGYFRKVIGLGADERERLKERFLA